MLAVERFHAVEERHTDPSHAVRLALLVSKIGRWHGGKFPGSSMSAEYLSIRQARCYVNDENYAHFSAQ